MCQFLPRGTHLADLGALATSPRRAVRQSLSMPAYLPACLPVYVYLCPFICVCQLAGLCTHSEHTATVTVMPARTVRAPGNVMTGSSSSSSAQNMSWWVCSWNAR